MSSPSSPTSSRPPSPELQGIDIPNRPEPARLQWTANYQTLSPQSLAVCRDVGAVAGSKGIAVFRTAAPHVPTLILNHAHTGGSSSPPMVVKFASSDSNRLASARGSGILVWDVSGRSQSPLQSRLGGLSEDPLDAINSIDWTIVKNNSNSPCLLASSSNAAGLWDLRQNNVRPTLRFAGSSTTAPHRQIAGSNETDECAILDGAGVVRIFDTRVAAADKPLNASAVYQFQAFRYSGVGLSYINSSRYVAWGTDDPNADPIVKIFHLGEPLPAALLEHSEEYVYLDSSPERTNSKTSNATASSSQHGSTHSVIGTCRVPHLACARVVPSQGTDRFVTIALDPSENDWEADLWKLTDKNPRRLLTFSGSSEVDKQSTHPTMRSIRAAELAVSSDSELLLFCLTNHGYITTHKLIPDALPANSATEQKRDNTVAMANKHYVPITSTRLFPMDSEWAVTDSAKAWSRPASDTMTTSTDRVIERRDTPLTGQDNPTTEGSLMPFKMEVPVTYSMVNSSRSNEDAGAPVTSASAMSSMEEAEIEKASSKDTKALMDRIETARIPCPRLCGVSFSPGVGGLVSFHNGDVKSMWKWWKQNNLTRLASVPGVIGETTQSKTGKHSVPKRKNSPTTVDPAERPPVAITSCPRTLKDLRDMTAAAKEAQWRERHHESEESSAGDSSNFYDDDSDGSSDSGDDHGDEQTQPVGNSRNRVALDEETSSRQLVDTRMLSQEQYPRGSPSETYKHSPYHSDLPLVKVTHEFDKVILNNQNQRLALVLQLGEFRSAIEQPDENTQTDSEGDSFPARHGLPSYRSLLPTSQNMGGRRQVSHKSTHSIEEERGVHGGEFSVGPNVQESMDFLRKMLTHRNPEGDSYPSAFASPLEDPARTVSKAGPRLVALNDSFGKRGSSTPELSRLGVYTIKASKRPDIHERLDIYEKILFQNAEAYSVDGQREKRDSWLLLAKIVRDRVTQGYHDHDGWGGRTGGSLGAGIADNILRYYESVGDVQMLATIVCVLRFGQRFLIDGKNQLLLLLPPSDDARYDTYLRRYSDLLFGWGLLMTRAEVVKHLESPVEPFASGGGETQDLDEDQKRTPGIAFSFQCTRCSSNSEFGTNYCRKCQDYAFRCTICDNAVRGLLLVCSSCGHGGHVNHLKEWFLSNSECPSGCGCSCKGLVSTVSGKQSDFDSDIN